MSIFFIILACLLFAGSIALLFMREPLAPVGAFLGLACIYFSDALPMTLNLLITWLCLTVIITGVSFMQPPAVMSQRRGMGYITAGALTGLAVGLLGFTFTSALTAIYAIMIVGVLAGIFFGYLLFTRTPAGSAVRLPSPRFFSYLLAKGFPAAILFMQIGVVIILAMLPLLIHY